MTTFWCTCSICGASFASTRAGDNNCGDTARHREIQNPPKDDDKKGGKR